MEFSKYYEFEGIENNWREYWKKEDTYRFDEKGEGEVFSVDTPPPYVSASHLHVGHAMSYAQADFIVRFQRMRGKRVFYPMGFDDNGLPTERFIESKYNVSASSMPRSEFVNLCLEETQKCTAIYRDLWAALGLSVDWSETYSTINDRCRKASQKSFIELYKQGHIERLEDPILWCSTCNTALAQADVDTLQRKGKIYDIAFKSGEGKDLIIATTRPELIPACVGMYCHPSDNRYKEIIGKKAIVPIFGHEVPILTDISVDPEFGTGLMMFAPSGMSKMSQNSDGIS